MKSHRERETKWDVGEDFSLPALDGLLSGARHDSTTSRIESIYHDTPDYSLQRHGITLRRRIGGGEDGWQLKVPEGADRVELRFPDDVEVPAEATQLVAGLVYGDALVPVATISTHRDRHRFVAGQTLLAEIADDRVRADLPTGFARDWREVEIELGEDVEEFPSELVTALKRAGARRSRWSSKLARAVEWRPERRRHEDPVAAYLRQQAEEILAGDLARRRGEDAVHRTRTAIRRLRSTLRVFAPLLSLDPSARLVADQELRWFAGLLGQVRDRQVQRTRFADALATLPPELVLGPVAERVVGTLLSEQARHEEDLEREAASQRCLALLRLLDGWSQEPPVAAASSSAVRKAAGKAARKAARKAERRLRAAGSDGSDVSLHRARKAAKRARYAAELLEPLGHGRRQERRFHKVQAVLGDLQDTVVAREMLRRLVSGTPAGESGFTVGLLYAREEQEATRLRQRVAALV